MSARRVPRWSEVRPLLRPRRAALNSTDRRLAAAASIADLRVLARRRAPCAVFDYTDGGAGDELALRRSRQVYERVEFSPHVLEDVSSVDTAALSCGDGNRVILIRALH
jgi:L-lactate dehydrogenase (cytochrome)